MDRRFVEEWESLKRRAESPRGTSAVARTSTRRLIAALGGQAGDHPLLANVVTTELLNRHRRAPFLAGFLVSATLCVATFLFDALLLDTPFIVLTDPVSLTLALGSAALAAASGLCFLLWTGHLPRVQAAFGRRARF